MRGTAAAALGAALLVAMPGAPGAKADVPELVNFQGRLLQADGTPETGILSIGFALYDVELGGSPLWSETQTVAFSDGFYAVMLGTVTALPVGVLNDPLWLSATVSGTELLPRMQVASVVFALRAMVAEGLAAGATGTGSGLDADSVDGLDATDFAPSGHTHPAGDADTLDGIDATGFALNPHAHPAGNADTLDGIDSTGFALNPHTHPAGDADTLDGIDSTGFATTTHDHDPDYVNVSGDTMTGSLTVNGTITASGDVRGTIPYYFHGAFATPTQWQADVIFNGNYTAFCVAMGRTFVSATELQSHYHIGRGNGYFYNGWYYVGTRYCASDTFVWGNGDPANPYNVWQYNDGCGCCIDRGSGSSSVWTYERSAIVFCS